MTWSWNGSFVKPEDILSGIVSLGNRDGSFYEVNLVRDWAESTEYLQWAQECLKRNDRFGLDAAVCYAKRAVCRQIDGLLVLNHLGNFVGRKYPDKLDILTAIGLDENEIVHELVIDPRNEVEHSYRASTQQQARRAVQIANLYLKATDDDASRGANVALNWGMSYTLCAGPNFERTSFALDPNAEPLFMLDCEKPENHVAVMLIRKRAEFDYCPLNDFRLDTAKELAKVMRARVGLYETQG
jgi:hypothetical protein